MKELILKKCDNCKALVKVMDDCNCVCSFSCCDKTMSDVKANSVDASLEKHVPTYEVDGNILKVQVNHVMEDDHYIKWIMFVTEKREEIIYFNPGEEAKCSFNYDKGILYSYCNKHDLWSTEVK